MLDRIKGLLGLGRREETLHQRERELVEQVVATSIASADLTCRLMFRLVNLKKLEPGEALLILGDLSGHMRDLAVRNKSMPGQELVFHQMADRIDVHSDVLQKETGTVVRAKKKPKGGNTR
jgi:hypothetical protein